MQADAVAMWGIYRALTAAPANRRDDGHLGAILASLTAEALGGWLCETGHEFTLLAGGLNPAGPIQATLLPRAIADLPAATAYWQVTGANLLTSEDEDIASTRSLFLREAITSSWSRAAPMTQLRWLTGALAYESHGVHRAPDRESERSRRSAALQHAIEAIGAPSLAALEPGETDNGAARALQTKLEALLAAPAIDLKAARSRWGDRTAKAVPSFIPTDVLSSRGSAGLSLAQALAWHLVEDEAGPRLTHAAAAELLGMERRQEVGTHIARARERVDQSNRRPRSSAIEALRAAERHAADTQIMTKGG